MCGRITLAVSPQEIQEFFNIVHGMNTIPDWSPRYNVAPTSQIICIRQTGADRELFPARWGLIPGWAKDHKIGAHAFNARAETLAVKKMFSTALERRRCLVIASGFYEWEVIGPKNKIPHYITLNSGEPMAMAGLWELWRPASGEWVESCTIITTDANPFMLRLHDRMPLLLSKALIGPWLNLENNDLKKVKQILSQYPSTEMQEWIVDKAVGQVRNQGEQLIRTESQR